MVKYETINLIFKPIDIELAEKTHINFFSQKETAKYLLWKPTNTPDEARSRLERWSAEIDGYYFFLIHEKRTLEPIGYITAQETDKGVYDNFGICLGQDYVSRGYGTETIVWFLKFLKEKKAKKIKYSYLEGNNASKALVLKHGFNYTHMGERVRNYDQQLFNEYFYELTI